MAPNTKKPSKSDEKQNHLLIGMFIIIALAAIVLNLTGKSSTYGQLQVSEEVAADLAEAENLAGEAYARPRIDRVIRANSCDADSICEIKDLVANELLANKADITQSLHTRFLSVRNPEDNAESLFDIVRARVISGEGTSEDPETGKVIGTLPLGIESDLKLTGVLTTANDVELGKYGYQEPPVLRIYRTADGNRYLNIFSLAKLNNGLNVNEGDSSFEGRVILTRLTGNSNAYLCIDVQGVVFRSDNPCK